MTTIGLIRHGVTDWNDLGKSQGISDIPLNNLGRRQAMAIASRVSSDKWDIIASSNLMRAKETAKIICASIGLDSLIIDDRLREIDCGLIEGTTEEERILQWGENWRLQHLGMEPYEEVAQRGLEFIEEVTIKYYGKRILIVSHGALIGLSLQHLLPNVFSKTNIDNTSLTIIKHRINMWECCLYNCTKHLNEIIC